MSVIVKSKSRIFGERLNTKELLEALKNDLFNEITAPIVIMTQFHYGFLKTIYLCPDCDTLHFSCGDIDQDTHDYNNGLKDVFIDRGKIGEFITKQELVEFLEELTEVRFISLEHPEEESAYGLTTVYKCDVCNSVHLDCAYDKNCLLLN